MSKQINSWDLLEDLSTEEQEFLSGGQETPDTPGGDPIDLEPLPSPEPVSPVPEPIPDEERRPRPRPRPRR